jgi:hypothetical protein
VVARSDISDCVSGCLGFSVEAGGAHASQVRNAYTDVLRRTRRNAYMVRGVGPDVTIERTAELRAGARPYQISSPRLNRSNFFQRLSSLG